MKLLWMSRLKDCYLPLHISLNTDHLKDYNVSRNCEEERGEEELANFQTMSSTKGFIRGGGAAFHSSSVDGTCQEGQQV